MAEATLELRTILEAAERAAAAQDFVSAEKHLRQAASLQEHQLGAGHPDLANTLNNLGIVCEYVGKPADAEACYRRAYRIASAALPADHPLVQTSGKNLSDFCEAIGKPLEEPQDVLLELEPFAPEAPVVEARPQLSVVPPPAPPSPAPATVIRDLPLRPAEEHLPEIPERAERAAIRISSPVSAPSGRPIAAIAMAIVLLVAVAVAVWWFGFRNASDLPPAAARVDTVAPVVPREEPPPPVATAPPTAPAPPPVAAPAPAPAKEEAPPPKSAGKTADVSVVEAKVCRALSTSSWTCTAPANPATPGAFFFYTRVKSPRDTTVQHRWYDNGRLLRSVSLRIRANPGAGYRTYSRNTVSAERRGNWTIELRSADGALLHEERFTVQ